MSLEKRIRENRRLLLDDFDRRIEEALQPFARALDCFLATLFQGRLPADWRHQWHTFVADQATKGYKVNPKSVVELEEWIEAWAKFCGLLPVESAQKIDPRNVKDNANNPPDQSSESYSQSAAALINLIESPQTTRPGVLDQARSESESGRRRGDEAQFFTEAEEIVSEEIGIPRNTGPSQQRIPGSGLGKFRILDFPHKGQAGSIRIRGTVVEVKASKAAAGTVGNLSARSRQQIKDAIEFILALRSKATLVKDQSVKTLIEKAHVEVFSDLAEPKSGAFAKLIERGLLEWKQIPRPQPPSFEPGAISPSYLPRSVGKPSLGAVENIALGLVISLAEAGVANAAYRESAVVLSDLLRQIAEHGDADDSDWREIESKLKEIATMKQSWLGFAWELITYGQGSLQEKQAIAMMSLAWDLADKYGYTNKRAWSEFLTGGQGRFERKP